MLRYLLLLTVFCFYSGSAMALSEYGLRCDDNKKCVACRDDIKCIKCMHKCLNFYGAADTDIKKSRSLSKSEQCSQARAKWCNAQCWEPDDEKVPDYVSTKPDCEEMRFPASGQ